MQIQDFSNSIKVLLCGGRHGASHIRTHLDCSEGYCHTIILDASSEDAQQYLSSSVQDNLNYTYIHLPGLHFFDRLEKAKPHISKYEFVTLVAVDDLISDESILEVLTHPLPTCSQNYGNPLVKGFGPDISYRPKNFSGPGRLFSMPKQSPVNGTFLSAGQYWDSLRRTLSSPESTTRLFGLICQTGFFPFFYSTYFCQRFYELLDSHIQALDKIGISKSSYKGSILFEYVIVAAAVVSSAIYTTQHVYRLNNFVCNSAGSDGSYSHRSIASRWIDNHEAFMYFDYFATAFCAERHAASRMSFLLHAAYQCLSVHSLHLAREQVSSFPLLDPSSSYQIISKLELFSTECSLGRLSLFKKMINQWVE